MEYKFKYPPILVGGKAMETFGLRKCGKDIDYIVHKSDYTRMCKIYAPNKWMPLISPAITYTDGKIDVDYFLNLYQFDYNRLKKRAIKHKNILIIHPEDLLCVKAMTAYDKSNKRIDKKTRQKNINDIILLVNSMVKKSYNF